MRPKKHQGSEWAYRALLFGLAAMSSAPAWIVQPASGQPSPNVVAWGDIGSFAVPAGATNVVAASVSVTAAALRADGTFVYWGAYSETPNFPFGLTNVLSVAAGPGFGLAVTNGVLVQWGSSQGGNIYPVPPELTNVVAVACNDSPLALRSDLTLGIWSPYLTILTNVVAIAPGEFSGLALRPDGTIATWGGDACGHGMLDIPPGLTNVAALAAGVCFSAALRADGTVVAWGDNTYGQTNVPAGLSNVVAIAAGALHCLALRSDGTVVEWGQNPYEKPWDNSGPTNLVASLTNVVGIAAGGYSSLAIIGTGMPPRQVLVTNLAFGAGGFSIEVPTDRGKVYALEYKNHLSDPQWQILPLVAGTGGSVELIDPAPGSSLRFYRVRRW
jgi:hypothetical protein